MPYVGTEFNTLIDNLTDHAYSNYWSIAQKNIIVKSATLKAIDLKVNRNDNIKPQDDLFGIYKTNQTFTPASNAVSLIAGGSGIADYMHMMNLRAEFAIAYSGVYISSLSNSTPIRYTTSSQTNLRSGDSVVITGVTGNTNANGIRYIKQISDKMGSLYSDALLTNPIASNGTYSSTSGRISMLVNEYAKDLKTNRKFSALNKPTVYDPFYEIANTDVIIYPIEHTCREITVDYISTPVYIDCGDGSTDLLQVYSMRFLLFLADETARLMGLYSRDTVLAMQEMGEIQQN